MSHYIFDDAKKFAASIKKATLFSSKSGDNDYRRLISIYDDGKHVFFDTEGVYGSAHIMLGAEIKTRGSFVVVASEMEKATSMLRDGSCTVLVEDRRVVLKQARRKVSCDLEGDDHSMVPEPLQELDEDNSATVDFTQLSKVVSEVAYARSTAKVEKVATTGVLIYAQQGRAGAFAMDAGASHGDAGDIQGEDFHFLADYAGLSTLCRVAQGKVTLEVIQQGRKLVAKTDDGSVFSIVGVNASEGSRKIVDPHRATTLLGAFSQQVIMSVSVDKKALVSLLKDALSMSHRDKRVKLTFSNELEISAMDTGRVVFQDRIPLEIIVDNTEEDSNTDAFFLGVTNLHVISGFSTDDGTLVLSLIGDGVASAKSVVVGELDSQHYGIMLASR